MNDTKVEYSVADNGKTQVVVIIDGITVFGFRSFDESVCRQAAREFLADLK